MLDEDFARIRAHRNNIHRYRSLLKTQLSQLERQFIERRVCEETASLQALNSEAFPIPFAPPERPAAQASAGGPL